MRNGYCLPLDKTSMVRLTQLFEVEPSLTGAVEEKLRVGIHWDTQVYTGVRTSTHAWTLYEKILEAMFKKQCECPAATAHSITLTIRQVQMDIVQSGIHGFA